MEHLSLVFCKTGIPQRQERRGVSDDLSDQRKEFTDKGTWECNPCRPATTGQREEQQGFRGLGVRCRACPRLLGCCRNASTAANRTGLALLFVVKCERGEGWVWRVRCVSIQGAAAPILCIVDSLGQRCMTVCRMRIYDVSTHEQALKGASPAMLNICMKGGAMPVDCLHEAQRH